MKISFRQGIVRCKVSPISSTGGVQTPLFLQLGSNGTSIDLIATQQEPAVVTVAHYGANYLIEETKNVTAAWGGGVAVTVGAAKDIVNSPLAVNQTQYLYWDIDLATAVVRKGWTSLAPLITGLEPVNPIEDQHWFDLSTMRMRVWRTNGSSGYWLDKIRIFAAVYDQNAILTPFPLGSQIGVTGNFFAGNILLGSNNRPLRQADGTFVTSETELIAQQTSGQNIKFDTALVYSQAAEEIPKYSFVRLTPDRKIQLASHLDKTSFVSGLVIEDTYENDVAQIYSNGIIRNEQWNWDPSIINQPIFCGPSGETKLTRPTVGMCQQVGWIYDVDSIFVNIFPPVRLK